MSVIFLYQVDYEQSLSSPNLFSAKKNARKSNLGSREGASRDRSIE